MEKKPLSQARIDANRANAKKSTGPRTAAGKARSSTNATRHGYSSKNFVLATENIEEYYQMRDRYMMRLNPRDELEMNLIDMMAHATWSVYRTWSSKNSLLDAQMFRMRGELAQQFSQVPPDSAVAFAFEELAKQPGLAFLDRYGRSQINQLQRALKILLEIRAKVPLPPPDSIVVQAPTCMEAAGAPETDWAAASEPHPAPEASPDANLKLDLKSNPKNAPATDLAPFETNTIAAFQPNPATPKTNPKPNPANAPQTRHVDNASKTSERPGRALPSNNSASWAASTSPAGSMRTSRLYEAFRCPDLS